MSTANWKLQNEAADGGRIDAAETLALFEGASLPDLGLAAGLVCDRLHPESVRTYVIDRNINYTNVCISGCKFCAFYRPPGHEEGYVLSIEEILRKVREAVELGATQILMQGGLHPDLRIEFYEEMLRAIKGFGAGLMKSDRSVGCIQADPAILSHTQPAILSLSKDERAIECGPTLRQAQGGRDRSAPVSQSAGAPDYLDNLHQSHPPAHPKLQIHSFSAPEIAHIAQVSGLDIETTLVRLHEAGLDSLPGGGAEILVDEVRGELSPVKASVDEWVEVMEAAARIGMRATATMMFGHIESFADRVAHLIRIRDLQDRTGVFTAFIPWTYQPGNTALGGEAAGGHDYLRTLAISRLVLDNVPNIQASWVTQGDTVAQVALRFGANDIGSTMIEENVVAAAGVRFRLSEDRLVELIHGAGFDAAQRDTMYGIIRRHERPQSIAGRRI